MTETPTPAELARKLDAALKRSRYEQAGEWLHAWADELRSALSRLSQVEQERDASDAVVDWMTNEFPLKTADEEAELSALQGRAITRHRSRQQRGTI
jgi:hypothetical protein